MAKSGLVWKLMSPTPLDGGLMNSMHVAAVQRAASVNNDEKRILTLR